MENIDDWGVTVIGDGLKIADNAVVGPKEMIDHDVEA